MAVFGALLLVSGIGLILTGFVILIAGFKSPKPGHGLRLLMTLGLGLVAMIGGGAVIDTLTIPPEAIAAQEHAKDARIAQTTAAARLTWQSISMTAAPCQAAVQEVADVVNRPRVTAYDLYEIATEADARCSNAGVAVNRIKVSDAIPREHRRAFQEAITSCSDAYMVRALKYKRMAKIADGDARPSNVASFQEASDGADAGILSCAAEYMEAAGAAGLSPTKVVSGD